MNLENIKLKNFTDLSHKEKLMILSWRNNESVRKWMYNSHIISKDSHLSFIDNLKHKKNDIFFLVSEKDKNLGVIYFNYVENENKSCYFGLYANPFEKIIGVGRILEEECIKYAFDILKLTRLKLEVFEDNERAMKLYKKYRFQSVDEKIVNDKKVICMELNKNGI